MVVRIFFWGLALIFLGLTITLIAVQLPAQLSVLALFQHTNNLEILLIQSYSLPRLAMAVLVGGFLGTASLLLQQVMNNPLASDNTLGISSGSQLALFLVAIFCPSILEHGASLIAFVGAVVSLVLVFCLSWRKSMSPLLLILAGLVVNLYFGAFSALMMLFYPEESRGLAQWGAGSLVQESWHDSQWLFIQAIPLFALIALLIRPFSILALNDQNAASLGVSVTKLRIIGVVIAAYLIAAVVSYVGMFGFIGLASATLVRQLGVRAFKNQLVLSFVAGALLLAITDLLLQLLTHFYEVNLPTGAVTALLGTPLLLWLMFRALPHAGRITEQTVEKFYVFRPHFVGIVVLGLLAICYVAVYVGQSEQGFTWREIEPLNTLFFQLRYPRVITALAVGILLSVAGVLLQRLTLNPMASPELLGVSSGSSMGILALLFLSNTQSQSAFWLAGISGALIALGVLSVINQRNGMLPEKVLLTGISLSALFDTLQRLAIASGSPKAMQLLSWTSGSTQQVSAAFSLGFIFIAVGLWAVSFIFSRWLALLSLQPLMAQSLGLHLTQVRWVLILFSALLSALATLVVGPLSFIGLLVPHLTRHFGAYKPHQQLLYGGLLGGMIMVMADWLGRQMLFPYEVPAGLVATLIGGGYFLVMMRKI